MTHAALATLLPRIDPARARLTTRLLAALDGAVAGTFVLRASVDDGDALPAIRCRTTAGDVDLAPRLVAGGLPRLLADDGVPDAVAAVAALTTIEPLVAAIERILGSGFDPVAVGVASLPLRLQIEAVEAGVVVHSLVLGVAADATFAPLPRPLDAARLAGVRLSFDFCFSGPSLSPSRIAGLGVGDIVLMPGRILAGHVAAAGRTWAADLDPAAARATFVPNRSNPVTQADAAPTLDPDLRLALTLRVEGGTASLGDIANLIPGSVLPLAVSGTVLKCLVEVGGAPVAAGEIVAIGDAYGVLITRRTAD